MGTEHPPQESSSRNSSSTKEWTKKPSKENLLKNLQLLPLSIALELELQSQALLHMGLNLGVQAIVALILDQLPTIPTNPTILPQEVRDAVQGLQVLPHEAQDIAQELLVHLLPHTVHPTVAPVPDMRTLTTISSAAWVA
jgi:hypothetical protein